MSGRSDPKATPSLFCALSPQHVVVDQCKLVSSWHCFALIGQRERLQRCIRSRLFENTRNPRPRKVKWRTSGLTANNSQLVSHLLNKWLKLGKSF